MTIRDASLPVKGDVKHIKGYKFRIYPTAKQKEQLAVNFGHTRFAWNQLLSEAQKEYEAYRDGTSLVKPDVSGFGLINKLSPLKAVYPWLADASAVALQQKVLDLGTAFKSFFGKNRKIKLGYPKFKSRKDKQSFRLMSGGFRINDDQLQLAKFQSSIQVRWSRTLPSPPSQCTVSLTPSGEYYVSFLCRYDPVKTTGTGIVGIDAGITDLATISNGVTIANLRHYVKAQSKLRQLQRRLSKKQKGSKNRSKARIKVAKLHCKISNQRNDYMHKLTTSLVCDNQAIAIERLGISNMARNHKLAKHILDAAWGSMREQLIYKVVASQHCKLILADPYYPSTQLCSVCGIKPDTKIKLGTLSWQCSNCHTVHQRDANASMNLEILARSELHRQRLLGDNASIILANRYVQYH